MFESSPILERGRRLLMLKRPDIRGQLASTQSCSVLELVECYDLAVAARDRFSRDPEAASLHEEYEQTCLELESNIVRLLSVATP